MNNIARASLLSLTVSIVIAQCSSRVHATNTVLPEATFNTVANGFSERVEPRPYSLAPNGAGANS